MMLPMQPLAYAEASEENPAPSTYQHVAPVAAPAAPTPAVVPAPAPAPARVTPPRRPVRRNTGDGGAAFCCLLFFALLLHGIYAGFLYGYIKSYSVPLPRGIVNHTYVGYETFQAFMYIFGFIVACIDAGLIGGCLTIIPIDRLPGVIKCFGMILAMAIVMAAWVVVISLGWIIGGTEAKSTYANACNSDWLEIVLTAHTWKTAADRNVATFSLAQTHEPLWTWTSNDPFQNDFNLVGLNSTNPSLLPSLSNVTINHATNELERAWCYNSTNQCATGYVWPFGDLFFEVQFNGTLSRMRNRYHDWSFNGIPSVIMHRVDENGRLAERLMQTSVKNPDVCKQIKVCVSHAMRRREGIVDPDVLVAAYWLLHKQAVYARRCTAPSSNY